MDSARSTPVIVQSTFDFAIREINALEQRIVKGEDDTDAMLWEQARQVVAELGKGTSRRAIAAEWINARTGKPYSAMHVHRTAKVFNCNFKVTPRPRFRDAYNALTNALSDKMAVHHSSETPEHYTPPEILKAVQLVFGDIPDLDPCSNPGTPNVEARAHYTIADDGLNQPWIGRVFVNPPYGHDITAWIVKLRAEWHPKGAKEIIALLPSRTDTAWFEVLTTECGDVVVCFLSGRLTFVGNTDPAPFPSMVAYFGPKFDVFADVFGELGTLWQRPPRDWFVSHV